MSSNITVNGVPLEVHVDKEIRKEIDEVRESENRIRRYRSPRVGASVSLSNPDKPITRGAGLDLKTTHVMIFGELWEPSAKAPYTASGESIRGAFEVNESANEIRCHECGQWNRSFAGQHVRRTHRMSRKEYLKKHGMAAKTTTSTPSYRMRKGTPRNPNREAALKKANANRAEVAKQRQFSNYSVERSNLHGRCTEQYTWRIRDLAKAIGRTPTKIEFAKAKINRKAVERAFGKPFKDVLIGLGLRSRERWQHV